MVKDALYSFMHDYTEVFNEDHIVRLMNPDYDYYMDIVKFKRWQIHLQKAIVWALWQGKKI